MSDDSMKQAVLDLIVSAFVGVRTPSLDDILAHRYKSSEDAGEMQMAFRGKHWTELPIETLFFHREMIIALSAIGYRAYIAAYLRASLVDDSRHAADLIEYTLFSLEPLSNDRTDIEQTRARLSLLDAAQRAAIASYLRLLESEYDIEQAGRALQNWS